MYPVAPSSTEEIYCVGKTFYGTYAVPTRVDLSAYADVSDTADVLSFSPDGTVFTSDGSVFQKGILEGEVPLTPTRMQGLTVGDLSVFSHDQHGFVNYNLFRLRDAKLTLLLSQSGSFTSFYFHPAVWPYAGPVGWLSFDRPIVRACMVLGMDMAGSNPYYDIENAWAILYLRLANGEIVIYDTGELSLCNMIMSPLHFNLQHVY